MQEALQNAIDRLPELLVKYAPSMMRRIIAAMQEEITQRGQLANPSYKTLLLKMSEADLVREFEIAIKDAMQSVKSKPARQDARADGPSLLLELFDEESASLIADFRGSSDLFEALRGKARKLGATGIDSFGKDAFLKALKAAFDKSRIEPEVMTDLMPYARRALSGELLKVYGKLDALGADAPTSR